MKEYSIIKSQYLSDISSAIQSKGGPSGPMYPKDMAGNILKLLSGSNGSSNISNNYIKFYDYDGTLLYSWTKYELSNKTELPELPSHRGLICQGWNYTLAQIKDQGNPVNVGAMYITDDGCTRIKLVIPEDVRLTQPLMFKGNVEIKWGDGSKSTHNNTSYSIINHTYSSKGEYVISIKVLSGTLSLGGNSSSYNICGSSTNSNTSPSSVYSNRIREVNIGSNVTSIDTYSFYQCYSLTSITIPNSVISMGDSSFRNCYSLTSITIPNSVTSISYVFYHCYSLSSITIPNIVTNIGDYAFYNCCPLSILTIPDSVTNIGNYAFMGCQSLSSITIPNSVTSIGTYTFHYCYGIIEYDFTSHTKVPTLSNTSALSGIAKDSKIYVPKSLYDGWISATNWVTYKDYIVGVISVKLTYTDDSVHELDISDGNLTQSLVRSVGDYTKLKSVEINRSVTSIDEYAFSECGSLSSITIPNSVTSIGSRAFYKCTSLSSIIIPDSVTSIGNRVFYNCNSLSSITIPSSITSMGTHVFYNCTSLSSIIIPSGVTSISDQVFYNCTSLSSIIIPNGVTSIGNYVFSNCRSLSSITIPNSVISIGDDAFYLCFGIVKYDFTSHTKVPTLSNARTFVGIDIDCKIVVPDSLYDEWISATNWVTYASKIIKESEYVGE